MNIKLNDNSNIIFQNNDNQINNGKEKSSNSLKNNINDKIDVDTEMIFIEEKNRINKSYNKENNIPQNNKICAKHIINKDDINLNSKDKIIPKNKNKNFKDKENPNDLDDFSNINIIQKIGSVFLYILLGHFFIITNIYCKYFKNYFILITIWLIGMPYLIIQIYVNLSLLIIYIIHDNFTSFITQFYNNIKLKFTKKYKFHYISIYTYYIATILFLGTYLALFIFISKIRGKEKIYYIIGTIFAFVLTPLHIFINIFIILYFVHSYHYDPNYIFSPFKTFINYFSD